MKEPLNVPLEMYEELEHLPGVTHGPLSWRDVYSAVASSEKRVLGAINQLRTDLGKATDDHEARMRKLEGVIITRTEFEVLCERVGVAEDKLQSFRDRESGIAGTLRGQRDIIMMLIALVTVVGFILFETLQ